MKKKKFFGIMFHHFHDNKNFFKSDGSIQKEEFYKIIKRVGKKNILSPREFFHKYKNNKIEKKNVCITFDDGLKSQFDVAFPVMQELNIQGFFFIPSSIFNKKINILEKVRYFKNNLFVSVNDYYDDFYLELKKKNNYLFIKSQLKKNEFKFKKLKRKFNFYSLEDIKYRFVRDFLLTEKSFESINVSLFERYKFAHNKIHQNIFMSKNNIKTLSNNQNEIGLHSHSHSTNISRLTYRKQFDEYKKNKKVLEQVIKKKIKSMAHPCGKYNFDSFEILKNLDINIGFLPEKNIEFSKKLNNHKFLIPREDHANLINEIKSS